MPRRFHRCHKIPPDADAKGKYLRNVSPHRALTLCRRWRPTGMSPQFSKSRILEPAPSLPRLTIEQLRWAQLKRREGFMRYYFHLDDGIANNDLDGVDLADLDA